MSMELSTDDVENIRWALTYLRAKEGKWLDWVEKEEIDELIKRFKTE